MYYDARFYTTQVHHFFNANSEAVQNAAYLLAGSAGLRRTQRLLDDFRSQPEMTRRMEGGVHDLLALLTLQYVHDCERIESECFAMIDPASPQVEEICLLADQLRDAMTQSGLSVAANEADFFDDPHFEDFDFGGYV